MDKIEPPSEFTFRNVMFWHPESRKLVELKQNGDKKAATILTKSQKFLENDCIEETGVSGVNKRWICKPIEGYNKTTYAILFNGTKDLWICNCQGFDRSGFCSHQLAVKQWEYMHET